MHTTFDNAAAADGAQGSRLSAHFVWWYELVQLHRSYIRQSALNLAVPLGLLALHRECANKRLPLSHKQAWRGAALQLLLATGRLQSISGVCNAEEQRSKVRNRVPRCPELLISSTVITSLRESCAASS